MKNNKTKLQYTSKVGTPIYPLQTPPTFRLRFSRAAQSCVGLGVDFGQGLLRFTINMLSYQCFLHVFSFLLYIIILSVFYF